MCSCLRCVILVVVPKWMLTNNAAKWALRGEVDPPNETFWRPG